MGGGGDMRRFQAAPEAYRGERLSSLYSNPGMQSMKGGGAAPGTPNMMAQALQSGTGGRALDMGVLPPNLQATAVNATPAPAGSNIPVDPAIVAAIQAIAQGYQQASDRSAGGPPSGGQPSGGQQQGLPGQGTSPDTEARAPTPSGPTA